MRPEGAPSGRAARVARRERGQSSDAWRAPSCRAAAARSARRRRGAAAELPMGGGHRPAGRAHAVGGRRRGVDAAVCGHLGPGAGGGDGAGDVEQRGVSAVRGAVSQAPAVVSQPAVGRVGPAGGLHRRQDLPGALHGGGVGDRHAGLQARPGTARRSHRDGGRRQRPAQRPGDARPADGPDVAVRHRRRAGAAPGHHRCLRFPRGGATLPSTQAPQRARPSARTAARFGRQGVAGCLGPRFGRPRGAGAGAVGGVTGARPPRRGRRAARRGRCRTGARSMGSYGARA